MGKVDVKIRAAHLRRWALSLYTPIEAAQIMSLSSLVWNEQEINQRQDGYVNVGQMCAANGKLLSNWTQLKSASEYLEGLSEDIGIPISQLMIVEHGKPTYAHPLIAIELARWISPLKDFQHIFIPI